MCEESTFDNLANLDDADWKDIADEGEKAVQGGNEAKLTRERDEAYRQLAKASKFWQQKIAILEARIKELETLGL